MGGNGFLVHRYQQNLDGAVRRLEGDEAVGYFDADGSLVAYSRYGREHYYPMITTTSASKPLIRDVLEILNILGFSCCYSERPTPGALFSNSVTVTRISSVTVNSLVGVTQGTREMQAY